MTDTVQRHCTRPWYMRPPVLVLGAVMAAFALFGIIELIGRPAALPYSEFLNRLDAGNVASVTFQGTEIDGRFKHPLNAAASNSATQPDSFRSRVPDFGDPTLIPELRKQQVVIDVASSSSWTRLLGGLPLPMLLMLGAIVIAFIIRLLRGGKAQSGAVMPVHPMQGMVGFVSSLFGRQDQPASKPDRKPSDATPNA